MKTIKIATYLDPRFKNLEDLNIEEIHSKISLKYDVSIQHCNSYTTI